MEYVTALDIWMVMSLAFIIVAMLETVLVTWIYKKMDQNKQAVSYLYVNEDNHVFRQSNLQFGTYVKPLTIILFPNIFLVATT